jgi:hypothetical protein
LKVEIVPAEAVRAAIAAKTRLKLEMGTIA